MVADGIEGKHANVVGQVPLFSIPNEVSEFRFGPPKFWTVRAGKHTKDLLNYAQRFDAKW